MSRIEDVLKKALQRQEPSPDFARQVMDRIASQPAKRRWWDQVRELMGPPKVRLIALALATSMVLVMVLSELSKQESRPLQSSPQVASVDVSAEPERQDQLPVVTEGQKQTRARPQIKPRTHRHRVTKSEGEIAKEKLMLALHIASATLNEAQRLVQREEE